MQRFHVSDQAIRRKLRYYLETALGFDQRSRPRNLPRHSTSKEMELELDSFTVLLKREPVLQKGTEKETKIKSRRELRVVSR